MRVELSAHSKRDGVLGARAERRGVGGVYVCGLPRETERDDCPSHQHPVCPSIQRTVEAWVSGRFSAEDAQKVRAFPPRGKTHGLTGLKATSSRHWESGVRSILGQILTVGPGQE